MVVIIESKTFVFNFAFFQYVDKELKQDILFITKKTMNLYLRINKIKRKKWFNNHGLNVSME